MSAFGAARDLSRRVRALGLALQRAFDRSSDTALARRAARLARRAAGSRAPDRATRRMVRAYARTILGSSRYRHWLLVYTAHHGRFRRGWIPDDFYRQRALPAINTSYRNLSSAKTLTRSLLRAEEMPDIAYLVHGQWFGLDFEPLDQHEVEARCFPGMESRELVVVKKEASNQGRGIFVLDRAGFAALLPADFGNAVVQRRVRQHSELERMVPGCTATVRVTTMHHQGTVRTVGAYLRVGRAGEQHLRATTLLRVAIVDDDGTLDPRATAPDWSRHERHPDTGVVFADVVIPHHRALVETCERLHARVPQFTIIGWDVVPEQDGSVAVFEWNTDHPDIKFTEASLGPGFVDLGFEQL